MFVFIIVLQITVACNKKDDINNELKELRLRGQVESISEIDYSNTGKYTTYLLFNSDGLIKEQSTYNPDKSLIRKWEFEYNKQCQKLARFCYVLNDSLSEVLHYSYNEHDKIVEERLLSSQGSLISKIEHKYDVNQKEIEKSFTDENNRIQGRILYKYDAKNNIIEEIHLDSVLRQQWKQKKIYNPKGLNVEILYLSLKDSLIKRSTYTYLRNRQVGETDLYNSQNELISKTVYEYDKQLNIIGKLISYPFDKKTEKHTFVYEYDKNKNWTLRKEYINNEVNDIITRILEYY